MIFYAVAFPRYLVTDWTVRKGFYTLPDEDTDYDEHDGQFFFARRQLEDMIRCDGRFREVLLDCPVHDTCNEMVLFYRTTPGHGIGSLRSRRGRRLRC